MSKKKTNPGKKTPSKKAPQNRSIPLLLITLAVLCIAVSVLVIPRVINSDEASADTSNSGNSSAQVIHPGESLIIPTSEISTEARFYTVEVDGTSMEILAVKDSSGTIRTAFNTCQICYSSGRGYYVQNGNYLICQNCYNPFTVDQVEIESGGCNPWPIFPENKTVTEDSIEISYEFLKESKNIFANWKTAY